jgi:hypothetical protein
LRGRHLANLLVKAPLERGLEPWYAVTTLGSPGQALAHYRSRMRIDEGFRAGGEAAASAAERMAGLEAGPLGSRDRSRLEFGTDNSFQRAPLE